MSLPPPDRPRQAFHLDLPELLPERESTLTPPSLWPHPNSWVAPARTAQGSSAPPSGNFLCFLGMEVQPHKSRAAFRACPYLLRQRQPCVWSVLSCWVSPCCALSLMSPTCRHWVDISQAPPLIARPAGWEWGWVDSETTQTSPGPPLAHHLGIK